MAETETVATPDRVWWGEVDKYALDDESVAQVNVITDTVTKMGRVRQEYEIKKLQAKQQRSELVAEVRKNPEDYGLTKPTVDMVNAVVDSERAVVVAARELVDLKCELDLLNDYMTALEHRKKMLENLVYLHGQGYFGEPDSAAVPKAARSRGARPAGVRSR